MGGGSHVAPKDRGIKIDTPAKIMSVLLNHIGRFRCGYCVTHVHDSLIQISSCHYCRNGHTLYIEYGSTDDGLHYQAYTVQKLVTETGLAFDYVIFYLQPVYRVIGMAWAPARISEKARARTRKTCRTHAVCRMY